VRTCTAVIALLSACVLASPCAADVKLPTVIGEGMVLQQGMKAPIFGAADDGEKVVVTFRGQRVEAVAKDGKFRADVDSGKAGGPFPMTIQGNNTIAFKDVYVGEVWVCSGQSNMDQLVRDTTQAKDPDVNTPAGVMRFCTNKGWGPANEQSIQGFAAVGYYFGRALSDDLKVPVGLIWRSLGATTAERWTPPETAKSLGLAATSQKQPTGDQYMKQIKPLQPYAIRGVVWYQGESNSDVRPQSSDYCTKLFTGMITGWRQDWGQGDFAFMYMQLPRLNKKTTPPTCESGTCWCFIREAQSRTLALPGTGMAVAYDLTEGNIHPVNKRPMAERLALVARAMVYGEKIEYYGPVYKDFARQGDKLTLNFDHADGLLAKDAADGTVTDIFVQEEGGKPTLAKAKVVGKTVVVDLKGIANPSTIYYAWCDWPQGNLYNKAGLAASPFRAILKASAPAAAADAGK